MAKNQLDMLKSAKLIQFIADNYENTNASDTEFAKLATKELGFPVNNTHIETRRSRMGIPATKIMRIAQSKEAMLNLLLQLERRIQALEARCGS